MPFYKDAFSYGNLIIIFEVEFPKKGELKPEQIEALKKVLKMKKNKKIIEIDFTWPLPKSS